MSNDKYMYARSRRRYRKIYESSARYLPERAPQNASAEMAQVCSYLRRAGGFPACGNTRMEYYPSGARLFDAVLASLKEAEDFVFIEYYALADGVLLSRIFDVLRDKAARGVDVRIIYDDVGSRAFSHGMRKKLRAAGIKVKVYSRLLSRFTFAMNYRDHRKMVIVDGKVAQSRKHVAETRKDVIHDWESAHFARFHRIKICGATLRSCSDKLSVGTHSAQIYT